MHVVLTGVFCKDLFIKKKTFICGKITKCEKNLYCIQGKFRPCFIYALLSKGEFKASPIQLYVYDYAYTT